MCTEFPQTTTSLASHHCLLRFLQLSPLINKLTESVQSWIRLADCKQFVLRRICHELALLKLFSAEVSKSSFRVSVLGVEADKVAVLDLYAS